MSMRYAAVLLVLLRSGGTFGQVFPSDSAGGISCFQCQSINQSNPACHDPFNSSLLPMTNLCSEGRKDTTGLYPGRYCFKVKGTRASDGLEVVVRRCSVDTLVDNALKSHYGHFKIATPDGKTEQFFGTVSMCRYDGCNTAGAFSGGLWTVATSSLLATFVAFNVAGHSAIQ